MASSVLMRKLVAGACSAAIIGIAISTVNTLPLSGLLAHVVSALGATGLFASTALVTAIHRSYPKRHDAPEDFKQLMTTGPYEFCRHPMYFFTMLAQFSVAVTLLSLWGILIVAIQIPLWLYLIKLEEKELVAYWGEKYIEYMKRTPMLTPRPWRSQKPT